VGARARDQRLLGTAEAVKQLLDRAPRVKRVSLLRQKHHWTPYLLGIGADYGPDSEQAEDGGAHPLLSREECETVLRAKRQAGTIICSPVLPVREPDLLTAGVRARRSTPVTGRIQREARNAVFLCESRRDGTKYRGRQSCASPWPNTTSGAPSARTSGIQQAPATVRSPTETSSACDLMVGLHASLDHSPRPPTAESCDPMQEVAHLADPGGCTSIRSTPTARGGARWRTRQSPWGALSAAAAAACPTSSCGGALESSGTALTVERSAGRQRWTEVDPPGSSGYPAGRRRHARAREGEPG
jgi:hypothetical protein